MRKAMLYSATALALAAMPVLSGTGWAQVGANGVPVGANPATGARPGNVPGTNNSLPLGNNASNLDGSDTRSDIAPRLPDPAVGTSGNIRQYLAAAKRSLQAHRTGEAQQSLEMAETRALDRSTPQSQANVPDGNPLVSQINNALAALGHHDMAGANRAIDQAMNMAGR